jgi:Protein of unknown function (DUF2971)
MPVTQDEMTEYALFINKVVTDFGCLERPAGLIWHYTDGQALINIIISRSLRYTQMAALNDKNELRFATKLYREAIERLKRSYASGTEEHSFLQFVLRELDEDSENSHGDSVAYVCCFSGNEDELTQWERYGRKGQQFNWGYAIGFDHRDFAGGHPTALFKVIYDREKQEAAAERLARATLDFYLKGLSGYRLKDQIEWRQSFFQYWDGAIYPLAAAVKETHWNPENEYRIYFDGRAAVGEDFGFIQRNTMLSRYAILGHAEQQDGRPAPLPIREIMIGPGNHPGFTKQNLGLLLMQQGYSGIAIRSSDIDLQNP